MSQAPTCALDGCENKTNRVSARSLKRNKYCSISCKNKAQARPKNTCALAGCTNLVKKNTRRFCSQACNIQARNDAAYLKKLLKQPKKEKVKSTNFNLQSVQTYKPVTDPRLEAYKGMPDLSLDYDVPDTSPNASYYAQVDRNMNG